MYYSKIAAVNKILLLCLDFFLSALGGMKEFLFSFYSLQCFFMGCFNVIVLSGLRKAPVRRVIVSLPLPS